MGFIVQYRDIRISYLCIILLNRMEIIFITYSFFDFSRPRKIKSSLANHIIIVKMDSLVRFSRMVFISLTLFYLGMIDKAKGV